MFHGIISVVRVHVLGAYNSLFAPRTPVTLVPVAPSADSGLRIVSHGRFGILSSPPVTLAVAVVGSHCW